MTDADLFALDEQGFIPGPEESEEAFLRRVEEAKQRYQQGVWIPDAHWDWVRVHLDRLCHVKPFYICAFYSNRGLTPWQGAATWTEDGSLRSIQLRKALQKGSFFGLYQREEILAHEAIHAARAAFPGDRYEEFLAYMTSEKPWRRILGPILQRPWEAWPFLAGLLLGLFWPAAYLINAFWATLGFGRLIRNHSRLRRATHALLRRTSDPQRARALLFRLTEAEIDLFAAGEEISSYAERQTSLRWRVLRRYLQA